MKSKYILVLVLLIFASRMTIAQNEAAAILEVINDGVSIQPVNTNQDILIELEAIVGVGDVIRTDATGEARITFFDDGTDVTLAPNTTYRITRFQENEDNFQLSVEVIIGQAHHRLNRILDARSSYDVETPGMSLAAQGTQFSVRVEENGRSGLIVSEGLVDATTTETNVDIAPMFGVRSEENNNLSDVVRASTFAELDAALDGCTAIVTTIDDVRINVRQNPSVEAEQLGTILAEDINLLVGVDQNQRWYRIVFEDEFAWILSSNVVIDSGCAGLRIFENDLEEPDSD